MSEREKDSHEGIEADPKARFEYWLSGIGPYWAATSQAPSERPESQGVRERP